MFRLIKKCYIFIKEMLYFYKRKWNEILSLIDEKSHRQPDIRNTEETLNYLLKHKCSMSRYGDGEFSIIFKKGINYQDYDEILAKKLVEILHSNVENHIVCIADVFGLMDERSAENKEWWRNHLKIWRHKYYKYIDMNKTYYNASATRVYKPIADKTLAGRRFEKWKSLWNDKNIVFIEGSKTRMGVGNDLFANAKSIRRIIAPSENAFAKYEEILSIAEKLEKDVLIILALGPTATVLSYELAQKGYWALDLGHIDIEYEWYLLNDYSVPIEGKYVNEVKGGNVVRDRVDVEYLHQIIYSTE